MQYVSLLNVYIVQSLCTQLATQALYLNFKLKHFIKSSRDNPDGLKVILSNYNHSQK